MDLPLIDLRPLRGGGAVDPIAAEIDRACRDLGFFYVVGHGVDEVLQVRLERLAREFFALDDDEKALIGMDKGGRAWRGWFPVGGELTSGSPDRKEGLYFGADLPPDAPGVRAGLPLHGANLYPRRPAALREVVREYMQAMTALGRVVTAGLALALGRERDWFAAHLTAEPTVLFRIFHYPPDGPGSTGWGVGEHTDYGLVTILRQDSSGGLEVRTSRGWTAVPPVPGSFVCNLGDMVEMVTSGAYRSTPHRVRNAGTTGRLSFPFFFDPSWDAQLELCRLSDRELALPGTYGDYLLAKVAKVFPDLGTRVLDERDASHSWQLGASQHKEE